MKPASKLTQGNNNLRMEDCVNSVCPWSGKPVQVDSLTRYRGQTIGFCNAGCRDKFVKAVSYFDDLLDAGKQA